MMFRDKSISKLYAYALAAVFALTLAGCGGGGGGAAATDPGTDAGRDCRLKWRRSMRADGFSGCGYGGQRCAECGEGCARCRSWRTR